MDQTLYIIIKIVNHYHSNKGNECQSYSHVVIQLI